MSPISPLRQRMIEDMTIRNLSPATQRSYLHAVCKLSRYFGRAPDRVELEDVRAFQVHFGRHVQEFGIVPIKIPSNIRHAHIRSQIIELPRDPFSCQFRHPRQHAHRLSSLGCRRLIAPARRSAGRACGTLVQQMPL